MRLESRESEVSHWLAGCEKVASSPADSRVWAAVREKVSCPRLGPAGRLLAMFLLHAVGITHRTREIIIPLHHVALFFLLLLASATLGSLATFRWLGGGGDISPSV